MDTKEITRAFPVCYEAIVPLRSISAVFMSRVFDPPEKEHSGEERGLISRTAAGYRAYSPSSEAINNADKPRYA